MKSVLKSIKLIDALILAMAVWIVIGIDFGNMSVMDKVYVVTFSIWVILFVLRLFILYRKDARGGNKKG